MSRQLILTAVLLLLALPAAASNERNLDHWFDRELIPFVRQQLVEHPRFKGETVMFVVLEDNAPDPVSNQLALSLRDRLLDAALHTPGVLLGWQQGRAASAVGSQSVDCSRDDTHYYIGIELSKRLDGTHSVSVRALDLEDRNWVAGFGGSWQGQLTAIQRQALRQSQTDVTFLGARDVPFRAAQSDLLAAHLAHKMACALLRESGGSYVVATSQAEESADIIDDTVQLVSNNLASYASLDFATRDTQTNALLSGKAHRIDGDLFQYWLTVTPEDSNGELSTLSTSAYVSLPYNPGVANDIATLASKSISIPKSATHASLGPLRVLPTQRTLSCRNCSLLSADTNANAIVFFLQYQANYGLVRLATKACRKRTAAHVVTTNSTLTLPIPFGPVGGGGTRETAEWLLAPAADTYYAVAVTDSRAARRLANHFDKLPLRCTDAVRLGLKNEALHRWLDQLATLAAKSAPHVDWRAIEVSDVL